MCVEEARGSMYVNNNFLKKTNSYIPDEGRVGAGGGEWGGSW